MLRAFVDVDALGGIVLCASVPTLIREYEVFAERWAGTELLVLGPGVSTGVPIRYDDQRRRRQRGRRVRGRRARPRNRDLDGRVVRPRRATAQGAVHRSGARDQ